MRVWCETEIAHCLMGKHSSLVCNSSLGQGGESEKLWDFPTAWANMQALLVVLITDKSSKVKNQTSNSCHCDGAKRPKQSLSIDML
jgi:hypothetical protein